jgi:Fe(II)/alpha-ketoglutarate-dependent arginine beta-hydroxylase
VTSTTTMRTALRVRPGDGIPSLDLTPAEAELARDLTDAIMDADPSRPLEMRLGELALRAHDLPVRLRAMLTEFRLTGRPLGGVVLSGLPVDSTAIGPTPGAYSDSPTGHEVDRAAALLLLAGSLLGDPFSYLTQQRGRLVLDVFPVAGQEGTQLGSSSTANLEWHNEDAFHPNRADWIILTCLRNHDRVPTTFSPLDGLPLTREDIAVLFEERFVILPDESHTMAFNAATTGMGDETTVGRAFEQIARMNKAPHRTAILSGDPDAPFLRIDPAFMVRDLGDPEAEAVLERMIAAIDARLRDVVLAPGEMIIIDNKRAVHGRRPFRARYDGTDRWLRRINVTADLRRTEDRRYGDHGRALV